MRTLWRSQKSMYSFCHFGPTACCRNNAAANSAKPSESHWSWYEAQPAPCPNHWCATSCGVTSWTNPVNFESIWPNIIHRWVESMYAEIGKYTKLGQDWPKLKFGCSVMYMFS